VNRVAVEGETLYNHVDLVNMLDIVDLEKGQEVAGGRAYYLKGEVSSS
jgi:seryl-tRNA synthetase